MKSSFSKEPTITICTRMQQAIGQTKRNSYFFFQLLLANLPLTANTDESKMLQTNFLKKKTKYTKVSGLSLLGPTKFEGLWRYLCVPIIYTLKSNYQISYRLTMYRKNINAKAPAVVHFTNVATNRFSASPAATR